MNFCELEIVRDIENKISQGKTQDEVIKTVALEISNQSGLGVSSVEKALKDLLNEDTKTISPNTTENLIEFFRNSKGTIDHVAYSKVKGVAKNQILKSILSDSGFLVRNNVQLNAAFSNLSDTSKEYCSTIDEYSSIAMYLDIKANKDEYLAMPFLVAQYLLAEHLPLVVQSWFKNLVKYNTDTNKYEFNIKDKVRQDYRDDSEKEAELSSTLEIMLQATPLKKFRSDGSIEEVIYNRTLTKTNLFYAINDELNAMSDADYIQYLKDPYYLIEYLVKKYTKDGVHSTLSENVIHSFINEWIHNGVNYTTFYKNSKNGLTTYSGYNPLDIFLKSFDKFRNNSYIDYDLQNGESILETKVNKNSASYGKLCDFINSRGLNLNNFPKIFIYNKDKNTFSVKNNIDVKDLNSVSRYIFGEQINIKEAERKSFVDVLELIAKFKSQKSEKNFAEFLNNANKNEKSRSQKVLIVLNKINMYNPYSVKGSDKNKLDKALPLIGISSVAGTLQDQIYRNKIRLDEIDEKYRAAGKERSKSPIEQTRLSQHTKGSEENLYIGTIYRSTLTGTISGRNGATTEVTKSVDDLSTTESFKLSYEIDFLKGWTSNNDEIIRIQAITPSDKKRIPFFMFSSRTIKNTYGNKNKDIEKKVLAELRNIYGQYLLNTINDFAEVLNISLSEGFKKDIKECTFDELIKNVAIINNYLKDNFITTDILNSAVFEFNNKYDLNKSIANIHDYIKKDGVIRISPYMVEAVSLLYQDNPFDQLYLESLKDLSKICTSVKDGSKTTKVKDLINDNKLSDNAKDSNLYTYFLIKNILSENVLVNTVGLPFSHKNSNKGFYENDSKSHKTMVKRMVALTATMHSCMPNVLSGLSNTINTMTIENDVAKMFAYSGNAVKGNGFITDHDVNDGASFSFRFCDNLLKQSITDVKPKGIDQKLLLHYMDPEKGFAYLGKEANFSFDNAWLRQANDPNLERLGIYSPKDLLKLSLRRASINLNYSVDSNGNIIDYNGIPINQLYKLYVKRNDIVYEISNIKVDKVSNNINYKIQVKGSNSNDPNDIKSIHNDLYSFWENVLGGEYSCDENGTLGEQSMDIMTILLNKLGIKDEESQDDTQIDSQKNINQYAKKAIIHYFETDSVMKSAKAPIVNVKNALNDPSKAWTVGIKIENLGVQLDPDHSAEDGEIHEITQMISSISEGNYVPAKTRDIYKNLGKLIDILRKETFIDIEAIKDPVERLNIQSKLDNLFGTKISRIFADPTLDVMGLVNELMREIQTVNPNLTVKYIPPYSDHQMLGKLHTTVGVYFNKFIARLWNGRGDVLVPSHNLFMIYEDTDGVTYMKDDKKILLDGSMPITDYLANKVWEDPESKTMLRMDHILKYTVKPYEVMPTDVYYELSSDRTKITPIVIDSWEKLTQVNNNILNGIVYVRAIDLPRNLRSKQVFISDGTTRIGMYYLKTMQEIAKIGILLNRYEKDKTTPLIYNNEEKTYTELLKAKKDAQYYFNNVVLKAISDNNIQVINTELPDGIDPIESFTYEFNEEERLTTNNYSNAFGINNMNFSEIQQLKDVYFKNKLEDKFKIIDVPYDYLMYSSKGTPTIILVDSEVDNSIYHSVTPVVDEDGYRLDANENKLYKWPKNAKLYNYIKDGKTIETIKTDKAGLDVISKSNTFIFYRSKNDLDVPNLHNLQKEDNDRIFSSIAKKQYNSWLKSNEAVLSRIPSQSMSFAMVMKTVGYLPWNNNITMVPNMHVFLEGSDRHHCFYL